MGGAEEHLEDWTIRGNNVPKAGLLPNAGCGATSIITMVIVGTTRGLTTLQILHYVL